MTLRTFGVLTVGLALALAGCGAEEESADTESAAPAGGQSVEIRESEFALDPARVSVDAAGTYTFRAVNDGSIDHALEIEGNGVEDETETIGAGESAEVTVELQEGTYELYCPIGNHRDQGMEGTLVVGGGGATTATTGTDETTTDGTTTGEDETETDDDSGNSGEGYGY